jgi:hypothetical protein
MCFSPLRRMTSELEGEEYTSRIVSGIDRLDPPLVSSRFTRLCTTFGETGKSADTTADFLLLSACAPNAYAPRHLGKPESLLIGQICLPMPSATALLSGRRQKKSGGNLDVKYDGTKRR